MPPRINGNLDPSGSPWYERLYAERLMTVVLGLGFDEYGANRSEDDEVERGLTSRGFTRDDGAARSGSAPH